MERSKRNLILILLSVLAIVIIVLMCFVIFDDDLFNDNKYPIKTPSPVPTNKPIQEEIITDTNLINNLDNLVKIDANLFAELPCESVDNFESYQKILITLYTFQHNNIFKYTGKNNIDAIVSNNTLHTKAKEILISDFQDNNYHEFSNIRLVSTIKEIDSKEDYSIYRVEYLNDNYYVRKYRTDVNWPYLAKIEVPYKLVKQDNKYILSEYYLYYVINNDKTENKYYSDIELTDIVLDLTPNENDKTNNISTNILYNMVKEQGEKGNTGTVNYTFELKDDFYLLSDFCNVKKK